MLVKRVCSTTSLLWFHLLSLVAGDAVLIGYGTHLFKPICAHACQDSINVPINCTSSTSSSRQIHEEPQSGPGNLLSGHRWAITREPTEYCQATNPYYRRTLAYCLQQHCLNASPNDLERYWHQYGLNSVSSEVPGYLETINGIRMVPSVNVSGS